VGQGSAAGHTTDFLVIGAGIVGLSIALELKSRFPDQRVLVLEKELALGLHASGRNSGVLHSGIYYKPGSIKARVCAQGAREWTAFCDDRGLPIRRTGKVLVPTREEDDEQLELLSERGKENGVDSEMLDESALREAEPYVRSASGRALLVKTTSVVDARACLEAVRQEAEEKGVELWCGGEIDRVDAEGGMLVWQGTPICFGHAVNCAGVHADRVAHMFGSGRDFTVLPFRGSYWKLDPASGIEVNHLVYPVPDLRVPFLGIHTTTTVPGDVYLGPTATPALGRESYRPLDGLFSTEALKIGGLLARQYLAGRDGFRRLALREGGRVFKRGFLSAAQKLLPQLQEHHLLASDKAGIRAQMLDRRSGTLVMDFLIEEGSNTTHVLNSISPAFTCAFPFSRMVVDDYVLPNT
jgi:(S)-2-hydroxyglutarate dehydrogenase